MTDAKRLELLMTVVSEERWVEGEEPNAAERRSDVERVPLSRKELMKRLRQFVESEGMIGVGSLGMKARDWTSHCQIAGLRTDLTDHQIEGMRLEELRCLLGILLRGDHLPLKLSLSIGISDEEQTVSGQFPDVVFYLAVRLVADSHLTIGMCEAPEASDPGRPNAFDRTCAGLFVVVKGGQRRRRYCSDACKQRAKNPKWRKRQKTERTNRSSK